jgi:hypothetical protein
MKETKKHEAGREEEDEDTGMRSSDDDQTEWAGLKKVNDQSVHKPFIALAFEKPHHTICRWPLAKDLMTIDNELSLSGDTWTGLGHCPLCFLLAAYFFSISC